MTDGSTHLLEGDGFVSNFFFYVWRYASAPQLHADATALSSMPSTVIFEHNFPKAWYYHASSSVGGGGGGGVESGGSNAGGAVAAAVVEPEQMRTPRRSGASHAASGARTTRIAAADALDLERRLGKDIDSSQILQDFCTRHAARGGGGGRMGQDVEAPWLVEEHEVVAAYFSHVEVGGQPCTRVEYLNRAQLEDFLLRRTRRADGFLQRWVPPTGKHNTVIEAIWSPHVCLVSKRRNAFPVRDRRYSIYDRAVTFEGPSHLSTDVFVAPHVQWQVRKICANLVRYLNDTHRIAVQRVALYFKVDQRSRLWLLWCGSLRVGSRAQLNLTPRFVRSGEGEEQQEAATARRITQLLTHSPDLDEVEGPSRRKRGGDGDASPCGGRTGSSAAMGPKFPRPPTMGPIGGVYVSSDQWCRRFVELQRIKLRALAKEKRRLRAALKAGSIDAEELEIGLRRVALQVRERRLHLSSSGISSCGSAPPHGHKRRKQRSSSSSGGGRGRGVESEAENGPGSGGNELDIFDRKDPALVAATTVRRHRGGRARSPERIHAAMLKDARATTAASLSPSLPSSTAALLWEVVRVAVRTRHLQYQRMAREGSDWVQTFLYCAYSHFLSASEPMEVAVPRFVTAALHNKASDEGGGNAGGKDEERQRQGDDTPGVHTPTPRRRHRFTRQRHIGVPPEVELARLEALEAEEAQQHAPLQWLRGIGVVATATRPTAAAEPLLHLQRPSSSRELALRNDSTAGSGGTSSFLRSPVDASPIVPASPLRSSPTLLQASTPLSPPHPPNRSTSSGGRSISATPGAAEAPALWGGGRFSDGPGSDGDADTVFVLGLERPLAEVQAAATQLLRDRVHRPAAVAFWAFVGHKLVTEREWLTHLQIQIQQQQQQQQQDTSGPGNDQEAPRMVFYSHRHRRGFDAVAAHQLQGTDSDGDDSTVNVSGIGDDDPSVSTVMVSTSTQSTTLSPMSPMGAPLGK